MKSQTPAPTVRREHIFSAPRHEVFRAWLDPETVALWMEPGDFETTHVEIDERVGGRYRVFQSLHGKPAGGFEGTILELVPDERLVFQWGFVGPERQDGPWYDSRLTLEFQDAPRGGTKMTLVHTRLDDLAAAMPGIVDQVDAGWHMVLEQLDELLRLPRAEVE